jgi:uncharacterized membrane protein YhhN
MMHYLALTLAVTVALLIRAEILGIKSQIYILKPASTLLVIAVALLSLNDPSRNMTYSTGILVGLALCFGGDLALMFQDRRKPFMLGLVLFLLGHIAYTVAFTLLGRPSGWVLLSTLLLLAAGLGFYRLIAANLGSMRIPVILYFLVISLMVIQATSLLASPAISDFQAAMIIGGAILFYISDVMLAANRFWRPWKYNRTSLALYYGGQLLIAMAANHFN